MTATHDDNATSWRDLADQLTAEQIAELEYCERAQIPPEVDQPQGHLNYARAMAQRNLAQAVCAGIPVPAEAVGEPCGWEEWGVRWGRMYTAAPERTGRRKTGGDRRPLWTVSVQGVQFDDCSVERSVTASVDDGPLTAADARQFAAALIEAAADLEALR